MDQRVTKFFSETVLLALIPALGFILLFAYEAGRFFYHGIPTQHLSFEIADVLSFSLLLAGIAYAVYYLAAGLYSLTKAFKLESSRMLFTLVSLTLIYFIVLGFVYFLLGEKVVGGVFIFAMVAALIIIFAGPLFQKEPRGSYWEKLEHNVHPQTAQVTEKRAGSLADRFAEKTGRPLFFSLLGFLMLAFLISHIGMLMPHLQTRYLVIQTDPECAVLYVRPDSFLCATFDRETRQYDYGYRIIFFEELHNVPIVKEWIGPLRPRMAPAPTR